MRCWIKIPLQLGLALEDLLVSESRRSIVSEAIVAKISNYDIVKTILILYACKINPGVSITRLASYTRLDRDVIERYVEFCLKHNLLKATGNPDYRRGKAKLFLHITGEGEEFLNLFIGRRGIEPHNSIPSPAGLNRRS